uniref:Uncharacterized protein n=1 Tax=Kalanchoe fedtschenkoi TaxID=63787 RepID=A0A7N0USX7_KALFE
MRDIASCFSDYAVSVADTASCASSSTQGSGSSIQNASTSLYNVTLSSQKKLMITVTWCKSQSSQGLSISFDNTSLQAFKLNTNSIFKRLKGAKVIEAKNTKVEVLWDLSAAKYLNGPEPVNGYYVLVMIDSEIGLSLGDMAKDEANKRVKKGAYNARASLISRREHCSGNSSYTTKAKFSDAGPSHDILIRCAGEGHHHQPALSVCIDKKTVIRVKRLKWNFRGNQSIFIDGLEVDLLWDVHDWFFNPASGYAVFAFRTTNGVHSSHWSDHKMVQKPQDKSVDFSLLIYAFSITVGSGQPIRARHVLKFRFQAHTTWQSRGE